MKKLILLCAVLMLVLSGCSGAGLLRRPTASLDSELAAEKVGQGLFPDREPLIPENLSSATELIDFDGDGRRELVLYFRTEQDGDNCVGAAVYSESKGRYTELFSIIRPGSAINAALCPDFGGTRGLVLGWGLDGAGPCGVAVCGFYAGSAGILYQDSYDRIALSDLDANGSEDVFLIKLGGAAEHGSVSMLSYSEGGVKVVSTVALSLGLESLGNLMTADVGFQRPALICEGYIEGRGYISDFIVWQDGALSSIFYSNFSESSELTLREACVWSEDIDGDGCVELPSLRPVSTAANEAYSLWFIDWRRADSAMDIICTSYIDFNSGWYLILPDNMGANITVRISMDRENLKSTLFHYVSDEGERSTLLWAVYEFIGDDAWDRMKGCAMQAAAVAYDRCYSLSVYNVVYSFKYSVKLLTADFHIWNDHAPELL